MVYLCKILFSTFHLPTDAERRIVWGDYLVKKMMKDSSFGTMIKVWKVDFKL